MTQAQWIGIDGVKGIGLGPGWRIDIRHDLADAARNYEWPRMMRILEEHPNLVNSSRPGGQARYAPLHQAAHGGAPEAVVRRLIAMGAWRTLRTRGGQQPVDVARRGGHVCLVPALMPVYRRRRMSLDALNSIQQHFHALIPTYPIAPELALRLPELEPLLEMERESVFFEVPGMYGGFEYWLEDHGTVPTLMVEMFCRVAPCDRFEITPQECRHTAVFDAMFGGPEPPPAAVPRPPHRDEEPALASIQLANGQTGYVELSPAGVRRLAAEGKGSVIRFSNADVVERHRHPQGIRAMSLDRLMRLRKEEGDDE